MIFLKTTHDALAAVQQYLPENPIIVEGGSFIGHDTLRMSVFWPQGKIHAFEPVPTLFEHLKKNCAHAHNIQCYEQALSSTTGTAPFNVAHKPKKLHIPTQAGSLLEPKERLTLSPIVFDEIIEVSTTTLDDWARQQKIKTIDFLWLDVQGVELLILQASPAMLAQVKAIYAEVEFVEAYKGQALYPEVKAWLEHQGFTLIARDFEEQPRWFFGNGLFVRKSF